MEEDAHGVEWNQVVDTVGKYEGEFKSGS